MDTKDSCSGTDQNQREFSHRCENIRDKEKGLRPEYR